METTAGCKALGKAVRMAERRPRRRREKGRLAGGWPA
jgi:hypothetical protein